MKRFWTWWSSRVGIRHVSNSAKILAVSLCLLAGGMFAVILGTWSGDWITGSGASPQRVKVAFDSDDDGLPDAVENLVGSDPSNPHTLEENVPDGWLHYWYGTAVDWNDTAFLEAPVLVPPHYELPPLFQSSPLVDLPSLKELYLQETTWRDPRGNLGAWWLAYPALDPKNWDNNADGIADFWLFAYGLDPLSLRLDSPAPGDPTMSVEQKYQEALDPTSFDTDNDGLGDLEELTGLVWIGGEEYRFQATDPRRFSSRQDGIPDGFLVRFHLDPHRLDAGSLVPVPGGLSVREAFEVTSDHCRKTSSTAVCNWRQRIQEGPLLDPTGWDSVKDGVPDAWALRDASGTAHPLVDARTVVVYDTRAWDASPWRGDHTRREGVIEDALNPLPSDHQPFRVTLRDLYAFGRPALWSEEKNGPWWGGLPAQIKSRPEALPPAVALRGWNVSIDVGLGRNSTEPIDPAHTAVVRAHADPRLEDTDGDGFTDREEYFGTTSTGRKFPRTNPSDPDTDGDGLTDWQEAGPEGFGTNPVRRDTAGNYLTDGQKVEYWNQRHEEAVKEAESPNFDQKYQWLLRPGETQLSPVHLERLKPKGSLLGGTSNILSRDTDADGLADGVELFPNKFLAIPTLIARPTTDPARTDTDGDRLPDAWEVRWSQDRYYNCQECGVSIELTGWPLDPTKKKSIIDLPGDTDWESNLAGDSAAVTPIAVRSFSSGLAYKYDLNPYQGDTNQDGISDTFSIQWGVESVPEFVAQHAEGHRQTFQWALDLTNRLNTDLSKRGFSGVSRVALLDPARPNAHVGGQTNFLGLFSDREKGTWVIRPESDCSTKLLPSNGLRREAEGRSGLAAPCWQWLSYSLNSDLQNRTNPWSHDFDSDGLPDAWEFFYATRDLLPQELTQGSLQEGDCANPARHAGLPSLASLKRRSYCLSYEESYRRGLDPLRGDTDRGGLLDWVEVALGLNPLNKLDDRGEEDWDGDGVVNRIEDAMGTSRLSPDTDLDGLLDGDVSGLTPKNEAPPEFLKPSQGFGDLCLRPGSDLVGNMEHRPESFGLGQGSMSHTQRYNFYVKLGLLFEPNPLQRCPPSHTLFKREGFLDQWHFSTPTTIGSGRGTNPSSLGTSGNALPDGWLVYWRDRASTSQSLQKALDPHNPLSAEQDPDLDLPNIDEYRWNRPLDWKEDRDGVWWGGLDPTIPDTDGDLAWYSSLFGTRDGIDEDTDNDGLPDSLDHQPLDAANLGLVSWNASQLKYETDYTKLWDRLEKRRSSHTQDSDSDSVPDFLDRARVQIVDLQTSQGETAKNAAPFQVTGRLMTMESPLPQTAYASKLGSAPGPQEGPFPIRRATVKAVLVDSKGLEALVGINFTQPDGSFTIQASVASTVQAGPVPACPSSFSTCGVSIQGRHYPYASSLRPTFASRALNLTPGPVRLQVVVEPNDPQAQPLCFGNDCLLQVKAYKDVPFEVPGTAGEQQTGAGLRAVSLRQGSGGMEPDPNEEHILHAAEAILSARVSHPSPLILKAPTRLDLFPPVERVRVGETLPIRGRLLDTNLVPLEERRVDVRLLHQGQLLATSGGTTSSEGGFDVPFDTSQFPPGSLDVHATVDLPDRDPFLEDPSPANDTVTLSQDLDWEGLIIGNVTQPSSSVLLPIDADKPLSIKARLKDHRGMGVGSRAVALKLSSLSIEVYERTVAGVTDGAGYLRYELPPLESYLPLARLKLEIEAQRATHQDQHAAAEILLKPQFPTLVRLDPLTLDVGQDGSLRGTLHRLGASGLLPLKNYKAQFGVRQDLGPLVGFNATTDANGGFQFLVRKHEPAKVAWQFQFLGSEDGLLKKSEWAQVLSLHVSDTRLLVHPTVGLRGERVHVTGKLHLPTGAGVPRATLVAQWVDLPLNKSNEATGVARSDGFFKLSLPARQEAGTYEIRLSYAGDAIHRPYSLQVPAWVQVPTHIDLDIPSVTISPKGETTETLTGTLRDPHRNVSLQGRPIFLALVDPRGNPTSLRQITDSNGQFTIAMGELPLTQPGAWTLHAHYPGSQLEAPFSRNASFVVSFQVAVQIDRSPASADPGSSSVIHGRLQAADGAILGPIRLTTKLAGVQGRNLDTQVGQGWSLQFTVPQLPRGQYMLTVGGTGEDGVFVLSSSTPIIVTSSVEVSLIETRQPDGSRSIELHAFHMITRAPISHLEIVLVCKTNETVHCVHAVTTDAQGRTQLLLSPQQPGVLEIAALRSSEWQLAGFTQSTNPVEYTSQERTPPWWAYLLAAGCLAAAALVLGSYLRWKRHHRKRLLGIFTETHQSLLDPNLSPSQLIRQAYRRILKALADAGYKPGESETVRDIARQAIRTFQLPPGPMQRISNLFELAVYSDEELTPADRTSALEAFDHLSRWWKPSVSGMAPTGGTHA